MAVLLAFWAAMVTGVVSPANLIGSFLGFVLALVVIAILAIIGAVFVGMFVSHRIMSTKGFTPFEQEMLRMRQEVRELRDRMDAIAGKLGLTVDPKGKDR